MADSTASHSRRHQMLKMSGSMGLDTDSRHSSQATKDPTSTKDKIFQRLLLKMGKQFGDDQATLKVISTVLQTYVQNGKPLKADDIDQMEHEIFKRISNTSSNIALDQFHPRLVTKAQKKVTGLDKHGVPIESIDISFEHLHQQSP